jgi:hypothetical protein
MILGDKLFSHDDNSILLTMKILKHQRFHLFALHISLPLTESAVITVGCDVEEKSV